MKIRLGFANNSSSTHSIIFWSGKPIRDKFVGGNEFGWQNFTAASKKSKTAYVAIMIEQAIHEAGGGKAMSDAILRELFGVDEVSVLSGHIDHQSLITLPRAFDGKSLHVGFARELIAFFQRPDVIVLGGNDNGGMPHPLEYSQYSRPAPLPLPGEARWDSVGLVARKSGENWALFQRANGAKVRLSLGLDGPKFSEYPSEAPELVDIKITDYCGFGCAFCYQGSTKTGRHADVAILYNAIEELAKAEVFEVAVGGGEPTEHPDFVNILHKCREVGIVPNFTTRSFSWLNGENVAEILSLCGSFAFSVQTEKEVRRLGEVLVSFKNREVHPGGPPRYSVQLVEGVVPVDEAVHIFDEARAQRLRVTLLAYKTTGRGALYAPEHLNEGKGWFPEILKRLMTNRIPGVTLAIDTPLAAKYQDLLEASGIKSYLYETEEGNHSMYYDAVEGAYAPSSHEAGGMSGEGSMADALKWFRSRA